MARKLQAPSPLDRSKRRRGQVNYAEHVHGHTPHGKAKPEPAQAAPAPDSDSSSSSGVEGRDPQGVDGSSDEEGTELVPEAKVCMQRLFLVSIHAESLTGAFR